MNQMMDVYIFFFLKFWINLEDFILSQDEISSLWKLKAGKDSYESHTNLVDDCTLLW